MGFFKKKDEAGGALYPSNGSGQRYRRRAGQGCRSHMGFGPAYALIWGSGDGIRERKSVVPDVREQNKHLSAQSSGSPNKHLGEIPHIPQEKATNVEEVGPYSRRWRVVPNALYWGRSIKRGAAGTASARKLRALRDAHIIVDIVLEFAGEGELRWLNSDSGQP